MIYTDLIELVGQYMTYEEFAKEHPEIELSQNDWYSILDGRTMRTHKKQLKQQYLEAFNDDMKHWKDYDYVIINNDLEVCYKQISEYIDCEINQKEITYDKDLIKSHIKKLTS